MNDLISKQAVKEWIENWFTKNRFYHPYTKNNSIPITELCDILEQLPPVQIRQVTGKLNADCISRQAAIDALCKVCANGDDYLRCRDRDIKSRWCDTITALRGLPSAQPEQRWIPCSERLPEEYGDYLVTKESTGWNLETYRTIDIAYFDTGWHKADMVLAWMPLPEPYKERREE